MRLSYSWASGFLPVKILFLMVNRSAKEFGWCWTRCAMGLAGGPVGLDQEAKKPKVGRGPECSLDIEEEWVHV